MKNPLITPEWLYDNLNDPEIIILDTTIPKVGGIEAPEEIRNLRIPGALFFDLKKVFIDPDNELPNTMPSPEQFKKGCNQLCIGKNNKVVVYDQHGIYSSPRAWWMFKTMGHDNVSVLNGGLPAWIGTGYPTELMGSSQQQDGNYNPVFHPEMICDREFVNKIREEEEYLILDARSEGRFKGSLPEPRKELRGGHIPNSKNLPYTRIVRNGVMISKEELADIYRELNPEKKKMVFTCGSGITACVIGLGAAIAGYSIGTVYDGSWSDWGQPSELPVELG